MEVDWEPHARDIFRIFTSEKKSTSKTGVSLSGNAYFVCHCVELCYMRWYNQSVIETKRINLWLKKRRRNTAAYAVGTHLWPVWTLFCIQTTQRDTARRWRSAGRATRTKATARSGFFRRFRGRITRLTVLPACDKITE